MQGRPERVLITGQYGGKYEGWHPTLGEFNLMEPRQNTKPAEAQPDEFVVVQPKAPSYERYSEADVMLKIKSFAPLEFESVFAPK